MDMDFVSHNERGICFNCGIWADIRAAAAEHGWEPADAICEYGLGDERDRDWDGDYEQNTGKCITAEDAATLKMALMRVLDEIPAAEVVWKKIEAARSREGKSQETSERELTPEERDSLTAIERLAGLEWLIRAIILLLHSGQCYIRKPLQD